jgi:hypothetical protein
VFDKLQESYKVTSTDTMKDIEHRKLIQRGNQTLAAGCVSNIFVAVSR